MEDNEATDACRTDEKCATDDKVYRESNTYSTVRHPESSTKSRAVEL